jgi:hypothetical protein
MNGAFKVEFKSCSKLNESTANVICSFVFTNTTDKDYYFGYDSNGHDNSDLPSVFRAFDSAGTAIRITSGKKGTDDWSISIKDKIFIAQFPVSVKVKFKLPEEDTEVTFLDVIGDKVTTRFSQIPIDPQ